MHGLRRRAADVGKARGRELTRRVGRELRLARVTAGHSQREVARRSGISQSMVSSVELAKAQASIEVLARIAAVCDHELSIRLFPAAGSGLRDSRQLGLAQQIVAEAHPAWHSATEVPVADGDPRAADLVFDHPAEVAEVEVESGLVDFQAQFRRSQLKREALAARQERPVRLVIAVPDTSAIRQRVGEHAEFVRRMLPISSRAIWQALRHGTPIGGDGLLFVRREPRPARRARGATAARAVTAGSGTSVRERPFQHRVTAGSGRTLRE